jgi:hypothetical protein
MWQHSIALHLKMVLGPKHVLAVTTEEEKDDIHMVMFVNLS